MDSPSPTSCKTWAIFLVLSSGESSGWCTSNPSPTIFSMVIRGCREPKGSWNTICTCLRNRFKVSPFRFMIFRSLKNTSPRASGTNCRMDSPRVVFPQPDSPTRARVAPLIISRLIWSTARIWFTTRRNTPLRIGKKVFKFRILTSGLLSSLRAGRGMAFCVCWWRVPFSIRWQTA